MCSGKIRSAAIIGAGIMGHSIAISFSQASIEVTLVDVKDAYLSKASQRIQSALKTIKDYGKISAAQAEQIFTRIKFTTDLAAAVKDTDFIVEAVLEIPDVKKAIFKQIGDNCKMDVVIASNTSSLDIFNIADVPNPTRLIAAHWFAPPHIIPLVEIAPGPHTSKEAVDFTIALMNRLGKKPVLLKKFAPAFIVNRIQNAIFFTVMQILQNDWADVADIDLAVKASLGIRLPIVGVAQTYDFTGLNLVADTLKAAGVNPPAFIQEKIDKGHLGACTSKGIYDYGSRSEDEILAKRDTLYLRILDQLEEIKAFEPI